ncbi:MAG: helix-turn-helix transcriptional regulator [Lachnospiraceae bacterium]|nr:helix-turn-helix transcriptional regulator [Lachnospiraceae bacterium]
MDTKQRILDEALTLFSQKGYANVFVNDIAEKVGIKAPSLYKHYKNKQAIFDEIIDEMNHRFEANEHNMSINGTDPTIDAEIYKNMDEDHLVKLGNDLFAYFLHDSYTKRFRKMLTLEQFKDKELAKTYSSQYFDMPLTYQGMLLGLLVAQGFLVSDDVPVMTLQFYAPIYLLLTVCDRQPEREQEAIKLIEKHIRQFDKLYGRNF